MLLPNDFELSDHLAFYEDLEKKRYGQVSKLPIILGKCCHTPTLETPNIKEEVL